MTRINETYIVFKETTRSVMYGAWDVGVVIITWFSAMQMYMSKYSWKVLILQIVQQKENKIYYSPEPMLIGQQMYSVIFTWEQFHRKWSWTLSETCVSDYSFQIAIISPRGQQVNVQPRSFRSNDIMVKDP